MLFLLSHWFLVLLLLLILLLVLSLSLIRCCCTFFSLPFLLSPIIFLSLFVALSSSSILSPLSVPGMINLLLSNFNSSPMLGFDDSLFLFLEADSIMSLTTRIFFFLHGLSTWRFLLLFLKPQMAVW